MTGRWLLYDRWLLFDRAVGLRGYRRPPRTRLSRAEWCRTVGVDRANADREARGDFYPRLRWLDQLAAPATQLPAEAPAVKGRL